MLQIGKQLFSVMIQIFKLQFMAPKQNIPNFVLLKVKHLT